VKPGLRSVLLFSVFAAACGSSADDGAAGAAGAPAASTEAPPAPACGTRPLVVPVKGFLRDISAASGITKDNFVPNPTTPIPINDHSRLAFADIDGDGFDDIVMHSLFPNAQKGIPFEHLVFLNTGNKTFRDFSDESGLRGVQAAFFVFADVDNDGDQDCFAGLDIELPGQTSALYLNDGKGHFTKKEGSGLEAAKLTANAVFADFDGDGFLDLYAGNGSSMSAAKDQLFFGKGGGSFVEASQNLKSRPTQPTNGVVACDYDGDGDLDIFVSHYGVSVGLGWRALWENDGAGNFTNVAKARGFNALGTGNSFLASTGKGRDVQPGEPTGWVGANGFGIDCGDVDGDGNLDIWQAAISHPVDSDESRKWSDPSQLFLNGGEAKGFALEPVTLERGIPFNEGDIDAAMVDFDNDGRLDLSVTRDKKYEGSYSTEEQKAWVGLFRQGEDGRFTSLGGLLKAGQNMAWADIDHDGDLDLLVGGRDNGDGGRANFLFENTVADGAEQNAWLAVRLHGDGTKINRDAIGARVTVTLGDRRIVREVKSSRGTYSSADSRALHFGLGGTENPGCATIEVRWPNGETKTLRAGSFEANRYLDIDY
jgi:hypothetical protein